VPAGASLAEVVRQAVQKLIDERAERGWEEARRLFGAFSDTADDVAVNHDHYLVEAFEE